MRKNVISPLLVIFALVLAACGARQARVGHPDAASPQASAVNRGTVVQAAPAMPEPPPTAASPVVDVDPTPSAPAVFIGDHRPFQRQIDTDVRRMLDEDDAWPRLEAERIHRIHLAPAPSYDDELVAALRIDDESFRRLRVEADRAFYAAVDDLFKRVDALEREERRYVALARAERRRASAADRHVVTAASAPAPEIALAASAAPPAMPKDAATVASQRMTTDQAASPQPMTLFMPDAATIAKSDDRLTGKLVGAVSAAMVGILIGILLAYRRSRNARDQAKDTFKDVPDGTLFIQEIRNGAVSRTFSVMTKIQLRKYGLDPADVESIEQHWFDRPSSDAATAANDEDRPEPAPLVLASGSGQISSQGLEKHGVDGEIIVSPKDEVPQDADPYQSIIYEDHTAPSS